jgi:hypothetical protein
VRAEARGRADDGAEVTGIGHAVQGGDERQLPSFGRALQQVIGVRVFVGPHAQREALVQRAAGEPVQLGGAGLEHRHAASGGQLDGLGHPLIAGDPGRRRTGPRRARWRAATQRY